MGKIKNINDRTERDRLAVVMEAIQQDFQVFGEGLDLLNEKVDKGFAKVDVRLDRIEKEIVLIKTEIMDIKGTLTKKADLDRLEVLERRVEKIEARLMAS